MFRIGQSSDIHQLIQGRKLILGGVEIDKEIELDKEEFEKSEGAKIIGILFSGGMKHDAD